MTMGRCTASFLGPSNMVGRVVRISGPWFRAVFLGQTQVLCKSTESRYICGAVIFFIIYNFFDDSRFDPFLQVQTRAIQSH